MLKRKTKGFKKAMNKTYRQLARRMALTAMVVALVPLYLLGAAMYFYFSSMQQERVEAELKNLALNRVNAIGVFLAERTTMLEALAHTTSLKELIEPGALQKIFDLLNRRAWSFLDMGVINRQGKHLVYVGSYPLEDRDYRDTRWFRQTMMRGVYVSDVFLGFRGVPHFVVAVKHEDGPNSWILRATIDSEVFTRLVRSVQLGQRGDAYIINNEGKYQTPPRFGGKILGQSNIDVRTVPRGINVVEREGPNGKEMLTAFARLPNEDWLLVIEQDPKEAFGPINLARSVELAILGLGTLLIAGSILFLVRHMVRRMEAKDKERAALDAQLAHSARLVSLGRMAAGVAHEINNPLAAIGEMAGLMEDLIDDRFLKEVPDGALFKENLAKIARHVDRVRSVTHRMLGFARRMEPHLDTIDVNDVLREAFSFLERESSFQSVEVVQNLAQSLPEIKSDRAQLQQVFLNLLNNALDAVGQGGRVVIQSEEDGESVKVSVADNGPGIPKEFQASIFDPFFTTKAPGEGTGLGLSISHSIMQKLGGSLTFASTPGKGTTFFVSIPKVAS